nr:YraN family protein [Hippea sp. KM1]
MLRLRKRDSNKTGRWAENKAARLLKNNGYTIIEKNFHCRDGEIDIIAHKGDLLVFVEVKSRFDGSEPLEYITPSKRAKIIKCARFFMQKRNISDMDVRFDAIGISENKIEWIKNAFMEE